MRLNPLVRFVRYSGVGVSTFAFDLVLLFVLTDFLGIHYLVSTALAFLVAVSLNYLLSRRYVFWETLRALGTGYYIFLVIALTGLALATGLMYVFVEVLEVHYLVSRVAVAGVVGMWNYLMNLYINFRIR